MPFSLLFNTSKLAGHNAAVRGGPSCNQSLKRTQNRSCTYPTSGFHSLVSNGLATRTNLCSTTVILNSTSPVSHLSTTRTTLRTIMTLSSHRTMISLPHRAAGTTRYLSQALTWRDLLASLPLGWNIKSELQDITRPPPDPDLPPLAHPALTLPKAHEHCCDGDHTMNFREIEQLYQGNVDYVRNMGLTNPGLLEGLANGGQKPPFMLVDCSDSRVNEQSIFSAQPGTMFTAGNIANQFDESDINSNAVLSYAVETLKVKHVVVLGHYGCGGVAASMMPLHAPPTRPADIAVQGWIHPIRAIYQTSNRLEIADHRERTRTMPLLDLPDLHDPAFRALVEENVKANVVRIANSAVIRDHYASPSSYSSLSSPETQSQSPTPSSSILQAENPNIYIHGWVYDVESGIVSDLGVSVGPPGRQIPSSPFPSLEETLRASLQAKTLGS